MRRRWPVWLRVPASAIAVVLLYWPFANFFWTSQQIAGPSPATEGNPVTISAPVGVNTEWLTWKYGTWRYCYALFEATLAPLAGILIYTGVTRFCAGPEILDSCCRRCGSVLRGLAEPQCPACGEPI